MNTKSCHSTSITSILHLRVLCINLGIYYWMWSSTCKAVQICDFDTRAGRWQHSQAGTLKSRAVTLPAENSGFSPKKLQEESFVVCLGDISGNNPHWASSPVLLKKSLPTLIFGNLFLSSFTSFQLSLTIRELPPSPAAKLRIHSRSLPQARFASPVSVEYV